MNNKKIRESFAPINKNELGQLKGGFSVYTVLPVEPLQNSVSVAVSGNCGCECNVTIDPTN